MNPFKRNYYVFNFQIQFAILMWMAVKRGLIVSVEKAGHKIGSCLVSETRFCSKLPSQKINYEGSTVTSLSHFHSSQEYAFVFALVKRGDNISSPLISQT